MEKAAPNFPLAVSSAQTTGGAVWQYLHAGNLVIELLLTRSLLNLVHSTFTNPLTREILVSDLADKLREKDRDREGERRGGGTERTRSRHKKSKNKYTLQQCRMTEAVTQAL